ncbi:hypothetical protein EB815_16485 [Mesorhizobium loti]|nr:hypothetical protein EB815_16485 [Mesorhizobium loti]
MQGGVPCGTRGKEQDIGPLPGDPMSTLAPASGWPARAAMEAGRRAVEMNPGFSMLHGWLPPPLAGLGRIA